MAAAAKTMTTTKELQVHSLYGSCTVQVKKKDTLSDVRAFIMEQPAAASVLPPNRGNFVMFVGDKVKPVWRFKEPEMKAWSVISNADWGFVTLEVYEVPKKRDPDAAGIGGEQPEQKKPKAVDDIEVMEESDEIQTMEDDLVDSMRPEVPPAGQQVQAFMPIAPARVFSHATYDKAMSESTAVLKELDKVLSHPENTLFCSEGHRKELSKEIGDTLEATVPQDTIIGCLGATGVGYV